MTVLASNLSLRVYSSLVAYSLSGASNQRSITLPILNLSISKSESLLQAPLTALPGESST